MWRGWLFDFPQLGWGYLTVTNSVIAQYTSEAALSAGLLTTHRSSRRLSATSLHMSRGTAWTTG